jgi:hypothetical protein
LVKPVDNWFLDALPNATNYARHQGFEGARWPKEIAPTNARYSDTLPPSRFGMNNDGKSMFWSTPCAIGLMLIWQQPHVILTAELQHRACAGARNCEADAARRLTPLVDATARFMSSYPSPGAGGVLHLGTPMACAEEGGEALGSCGAGCAEDAPNHVYDGVFELSYWRYGLLAANVWRVRQGLPENTTWADTARRLAPLPTVNDPDAPVGRGDTSLYNFHAGCANPYSTQASNKTAVRTPWGQYCPVLQSHPQMVGAHGMVPGELTGVDMPTMNRTFDAVMGRWDWGSAMGWDYPMLAMTAMRLGRPEDALNALMWKWESPGAQNTYLRQGWQLESFGPYFPANGGLLLAVGMAAGGWGDTPAPLQGFPASWRTHMQAEGFSSYV